MPFPGRFFLSRFYRGKGCAGGRVGGVLPNYRAEMHLRTFRKTPGRSDLASPYQGLRNRLPIDERSVPRGRQAARAISIVVLAFSQNDSVLARRLL